MRLRAFLALALILFTARCVPPPDEGVVVYVVRHAERADDGAPANSMMGNDPPLSEAGLARARELAELLRPVGLTDIHSTDYVRTRSTALPISEATQIPITLYDPAGLDAFARELLATPGTHLVVGHSDTAPELVRALGGEPGPPIAPLEYDRVYVVYALADGTTGSAVFRYGSPYSAVP